MRLLALLLGIRQLGFPGLRRQRMPLSLRRLVVETLLLLVTMLRV
jgi:hypothetical protein